MFEEALRLALVYIHFISAAFWIGGTIFVAAVLVPTNRNFQPPGSGTRFLREAVRRFSRIGWVVLLILILSGLGVLERNGLMDRLGDSDFWSTEIGTVIIIKGVFVILMLVLSYVHDFILGPKLADALLALEPGARPSAAFTAARRKLLVLARINLLLALSIALLGMMIFRGIPG
jgi:putative copper export protein